MKRTSVFLLLLLLLSFPAFTQCVLTGKVVDGQGNTPVEFANVAIYTHDSTFVVGGATNRLGEFRLSKVEAGEYSLQVSCVGFRTLRQSVVCGEGRIELGTMQLQTDSQELEEAHATADLRQADRLFVYPSAQQLKFSHNGIDLLMNLQLHRLWIDPVKRSIEALDGGKVGFLINGQPAEQADIQALHPKYILRVKYIDRPGLRYKDYAVVINYVTKAKEGSGLLAAQAEHMFRFHTGNALLMGKFYRKRAEAGFNYQMTYQTNATNDYYQSERYAFAPDSTVTYEWQDAGIDYKTRIHQGQIYYTNREEDKYYFNATLRLQYAGQPYRTIRLQGSTPEGKPVGEKERYTSQDFYAPSLELYYDRHLSGNQFLAFNAVGTYMTNTTQNSFTNLHDTVLLSQGGTRQDIDRYSWIGEGYYEITKYHGEKPASPPASKTLGAARKAITANLPACKSPKRKTSQKPGQKLPTGAENGANNSAQAFTTSVLKRTARHAGTGATSSCSILPPFAGRCRQEIPRFARDQRRPDPRRRLAVVKRQSRLKALHRRADHPHLLAAKVQIQPGSLRILPPLLPPGHGRSGA